MGNLTIAVLGGLLGMVGFGSSNFLAKKTIGVMSNLQVLIFSQFIGAGFMTLYLIREPALPALTPPNLRSVLVFGLLNALAYVLFYRALDVGKASIVTPISSTFNIAVPVVSFFFLRESFPGLKIVALVLVVVGVVLTAIQSTGVGERGGDLAKGLPYVAGWVLIWGFYLPLWDRFVEGDGWLVWVLLVKVVLVVAVTLYASLVRKEKLGFSSGMLLLWLVLIGFCEAVATLGMTWAFNASVNTTSIITALTSAYPLVTVLLALAVLKERVATHQGIGIGLIIVGMVFLPFI